MQLSGECQPPLNPEQECEKNDRHKALIDAMRALTPREEKVLRARFWDMKTKKQIGRELGVTRTTVYLVELSALRKLRHPRRIEKLERPVGA